MARKKSPPKKKQAPSRSWGSALWPPFVVLASIGILLATMYTVYLDHRVRSQFEGARWSLPAKVYARPMEIYPGLRLKQKVLVEELNRLGYRSVAALSGPGTYVDSKDNLKVITRQFRFWDGLQPEKQLQINFASDRVSKLIDLANDKEGHITRLDPLLIGSIYPVKGEDRILLRISEVPELLIDGLMAVEDRDFRGHFGVDPKSIIRAVFVNLKAGRVVQGGSTLTQQLVKNFFLTRDRTITRKIKEAIMAVLLELHYSKDEILEAYLNEVYLGQDGARAIHGFGLASHYYFNKPLSELRVEEVALLVGMVKGPSFYDPRRRLERATQRRNTALEMFVNEGLIEVESLDARKKKSLGVVKQPPQGTTHFPAFVDLVRRQLRGHYREADLTSEGLQIFTTLDPRTQQEAEKQLKTHLNVLEKSRGLPSGKLEAAAVITSVDGGEVLALVGGRDTSYAGFNRALDARRPIGSLVKPAVYLTALSRPHRYSLVTLLNDEALYLIQPNGDPWEPKNYDKEYHGDEVPLYISLAKSYNVSTVRLGLDVGIPSVVETLNKLGLKGKPMAVPSLALGAFEMAPLEVAQIYNTLATGGYYTPLLSIREVLSKNSEPLSRYPLRLRQAYDDGPVYILNWAMEQVMRAGTGKSAYSQISKDINLAGKTGTTDDLRDSWFAGYSGNRLGVVWVGRDDNSPAKLSGATGALQIWSRIMAQLELESFEPNMPDNVVMIPLDPGEIEHDDEDCDQRMNFPFIRGTVDEDIEPCEEGSRRDSKSTGNWLLDLFR